jgi:hypothetical protein
MVIETFALAAPPANNIKPAKATRKERILPLASSLRVSGLEYQA